MIRLIQYGLQSKIRAPGAGCLGRIARREAIVFFATNKTDDPWPFWSVSEEGTVKRPVPSGSRSRSHQRAREVLVQIGLSER